MNGEHEGVQLTPTLVIGIGGTGVQVVRRVKGDLTRHFDERNLGQVPPVLRFLAIDSVALSNPKGTTPLERQEYVYLGHVDGNQVINNLRYHPEVAEWWDLKRSLPGHIDDGCGQMRDVGRLSFFYHYTDFVTRLNEQINQIRRHENLDRTEQRGFQLRRDQIRICVVCSLAGGTGSGMFLDVAYNVRHAVRRMTSITSSVVGYLVLPDVYLPCLDSIAMRESVQANGYASLTEIEHLNRHPEAAKEVFHHYPGGHTIQAVDRPFDHTFLVSSRDQLAQTLDSPEQVYDSIAEKLFLEAVYLDQAMRENEVNIFADRDAGNGVSGTSIGRYYSSFSVSGVTVRRDIALEYCTRSFALEAVEHLLERSTDEKAQPPREDIAPEALIEGISQRVTGIRPFPVLYNRAEPETKPLLDTLSRNEQLLHKWLDDCTQLVDEATSVKREELRRYLEDRAWEIALERGIEAVFPYLHNWLQQLQATADKLRDMAGELDRTTQRTNAGYDSGRKSLSDIALGPGMRVLLFDTTAKRRHKREQIFDTARIRLQTMYEARLQREIMRQINASVVRALMGDTATDDTGSISRMMKRWQSLHEVLINIEADVRKGLQGVADHVHRLEQSEAGYAIARDISLSDTDLRVLYDEVKIALSQADFLSQIAAEIRRTDPDGVDPANQVRDHVRDLMLQRSRSACLELFGVNHPGVTPDEAVAQANEKVRLALSDRMGRYLSRPGVLDALFHHNVPYWDFSDFTNATDRLERTNLVAIESMPPEGWQVVTQDSRWRSIQQDKQKWIETGDPGLLAAYRAAYGLPAFVLNEIPDLRVQYLRRQQVNAGNRNDRRGLSLHIWSSWNDEVPVDLMLDDAGEPLLAGTTDIDEIYPSLNGHAKQEEEQVRLTASTD